MTKQDYLQSQRNIGKQARFWNNKKQSWQNAVCTGEDKNGLWFMWQSHDEKYFTTEELINLAELKNFAFYNGGKKDEE